MDLPMVLYSILSQFSSPLSLSVQPPLELEPVSQIFWPQSGKEFISNIPTHILFIYIYPVALRAISTTVPLRSLLFGVTVSKKMNKKSDKNQATIHAQLLKNHRKLKLGGVPEGRGRSWDHFGSQGCPSGVPGTPGAKKVTKSLFVPGSFPIPGVSPNCTFSVLFRFSWCLFVDVFRKRFRTPLGTMFRGF